MDECFDFNDCDQVALIGEAVTKDILPRFGFKNVKLVRSEKEYQDEDIDFIAERNGEAKKIETKTDTTLWPNIFYETVSNEEAGTVGCMLKTKADYLFYYFCNKDAYELYVFQMNPYREWANKYIEEHYSISNLKSIKNKRKRNGREEIYHTLGYVIPKKEIEKQPWVVKYTGITWELLFTEKEVE